MALLRLRLYRMNSPLQFLRRGRGLSRLREPLELKFAHESTSSQEIYTHLQGAGDPVRDLSTQLTSQGHNIIRILGRRPTLDNLEAFTVPGLYSDGKGHIREHIRQFDSQTGAPTGTELGPVISRIDILYVEDWLKFVRTLERELEAAIRNNTAEPRDRALHERLTDLQFDDYTKSYYNRIFSFSDRDWIGVSVNDIVNADTGVASVTFDGSSIEVKTIMRKPGGGRFGKIKFDFTFNEISSIRTTQGIDFRKITRHEIGEVDFKITRPGFAAVSKSNKEELSELFQAVWITRALEQLNRELESDFRTRISNLWQEILVDYPATLSYSHYPEIAVTRGGLADETLTRIIMVNGLPLWRNVSARRPCLTGCIVRHRAGATLLGSP